jgi:hypothetical protein
MKQQQQGAPFCKDGHRQHELVRCIQGLICTTCRKTFDSDDAAEVYVALRARIDDLKQTQMAMYRGLEALLDITCCEWCGEWDHKGAQPIVLAAPFCWRCLAELIFHDEDDRHGFFEVETYPGTIESIAVQAMQFDLPRKMPAEWRDLCAAMPELAGEAKRVADRA